jgi:hypothetical protein
MAVGSDRNKEEKACFLSSQRGGDSTDYHKPDQAKWQQQTGDT